MTFHFVTITWESMREMLWTFKGSRPLRTRLKPCWEITVATCWAWASCLGASNRNSWEPNNRRGVETNARATKQKDHQTCVVQEDAAQKTKAEISLIFRHSRSRDKYDTLAPGTFLIKSNSKLLYNHYVKMVQTMLYSKWMKIQKVNKVLHK